MGLAFWCETGKRIASTSSAPIVGGPAFGRAYYPRSQSTQRVHFVRDLGGLPFEKAALIGTSGTQITNRCTNPRFASGTTGWTNVDQWDFGGMWGAGGWGLISDQNSGVAALDAYYSYATGGLSGQAIVFSLWVRAESSTASVKVRIEIPGGTIYKTSSYRSVRATDGWVHLSLVVRRSLTTAAGTVKAGIEFATGTNSRLAIDGALLAFPAEPGAGAITAETSNTLQAYHDGSIGSSAWSGTTDASSSTVAADRQLTWEIQDIPFSFREGYLSCFYFPPVSPSETDWSADAAITEPPQSYLICLGTAVRTSFKKRVGADGWTIGGADLAWPHCALHVVHTWGPSGSIIGIRGYFNPEDYGLTSNVYVTTAAAPNNLDDLAGQDFGLGYSPGGSGLFDGGTLGGYVRDACLGNRALTAAEVQGVLAHGPGPYTGTVAWAPLDEDTDLRLIEAFSFHADGPLGLREGGYAPQSGLVTSSGSARSAAELTKTSTQNAIESFQFSGRLGDVQLMHRAVSDLSQLFENVHRQNEQGSRYTAYVGWAMDPAQPNHPTLRNMPAPRQLRSRLVWGNIELDPRLSSYYGRRGTIWGQVRFERWGYWEGPRTRLLLAKSNSSTPALTYTTENANDASGTTDSNYFEVPEGLVEGNLEAACLMYLRDPVSAEVARVRLARRSRGVPADVVAAFEAEAAGNVLASGAATSASYTDASGATVVERTFSASEQVDLVEFEIVDADSAIPAWLDGEFRAVAIFNAGTGSGSAAVAEVKGRAKCGSYSAPYGETVSVWLDGNTGNNWYAVDMGLFRLPPLQLPHPIGSVGGSGVGISFTVNVKNVAAVSNAIRLDALLLLPADENYVQAEKNSTAVASGAGGLCISALEGREVAYVLDASDRVEDFFVLRGSRGVYVQPGRPNRFWLLVEKNAGAGSAPRIDFNSGAEVSLEYVPRYLLLASYEGGGGGGWA